MASSPLTTEEREAMIGLAAHAMVGPLRNIRVLLGMVCEDAEAVTAEAAALIETARTVAEHAEATTTDIVEYTMAALVSDMVEVDLQRLVEGIVSEQDPDNIVVVDVPPVTLETDAVALHASLCLLLRRGLRDPAPGRRIDVTIVETDERSFELAVIDNGRDLSLAEERVISRGVVRSGVGFTLYGLRNLAHLKGGDLRYVPVDAGAHIVLELPGRIKPGPASQDDV